MDFEDTPEEAAFRPKPGPSSTPMPSERRPVVGLKCRTALTNWITIAKAWQAKKAAAGFAGIIQPKEYGGRGGTTMERVIYDQEEANYITPIGVYEIGWHVHPDDADLCNGRTKQRYAPPAFRGEEICVSSSRAPSRLRSSEPAFARGTRRRRLDPKRPEDLDIRRAFLRLRRHRDTQRSHRGEAQRPLPISSLI